MAAPGLKPDICELPELLAALAEAVSIQAALALVEWRGGVPIYIPQDLPPGHEMTLRIGLPAARWLCDQYPGEYMKIPMAKDYMRHLRDNEMRRLHRAGTTAYQLVRDFGVDLRTVRRVLAADTSGADSRQQALL